MSLGRVDRRTGWLVALVAMVILGGVAWTIFSQLHKSTTVRINSTVLSATIADTEALREKGLAGKEKLGRNEALLLVFADDGHWPIWMKDMKIPLDVIWLNSNKEVVHITKNVGPQTYPKRFKPSEPARYVLEIEAGRAEREKIRIGQKAHFDLQGQ